MKDNWTKAFQDKLDDYQLEMPAAAPHRQGRRIALMLSGTAAAAVAAVLLLRMPDDGKQGPTVLAGVSEGLIAEAPTVVAIMQPDLPAAIRPIRSFAAGNPQPKQTAAQEEERLEEPILTTEPVQPTEPASPAVRPDEPVGPVEPAKADVPEEAVIDWNEEDETTHHRTDISARLHVNPLGLQAGVADNLPDPTGILRGAKASNMGDYAYNLNRNVFWSTSSEIGQKYGWDQVHCDMPVKTGLSVRIGGAGRLSLESGLDFSFHRATAAASYGLLPAPYQMEYRMHYLGIPVKGIFSIAEWRRLSLYAAAGGEVEWMVFGRMLIRESSQTLVDDRLQEHPFLFSLTGAGGLEFNFTPTLGLYAEPGIAWHATPKGNLPNYYRDHPLSFDLHLGLRFNLQ